MTIHPTAIVDRRAEIDPSAEIGPYCVIDGDVWIGPNCRLYQNVFVTGWTRIEADCELHPGVIVGHVPQDVKHKNERSFCRIGRGTILREYATVHRGTAAESETVIGENCYLLGGCHVAHNGRLGNRVTLVNHVLLGGHVTVQGGATIGGGTVVHQFVRIGELSMVGGGGRVPMDVPPFSLLDEEGKVAGMNRVGMRRAGVPQEVVVELREAYRVLYGKGLPFREAVPLAVARLRTDAGRRLAAFLQEESKRGIAGSSRKRAAPVDSLEAE